jgi:hypothetical protein
METGDEAAMSLTQSANESQSDPSAKKQKTDHSDGMVCHWGSGAGPDTNGMLDHNDNSI